jgi:hypothetical protein
MLAINMMVFLNEDSQRYLKASLLGAPPGTDKNTPPESSSIARKLNTRSFYFKQYRGVRQQALLAQAFHLSSYPLSCKSTCAKFVVAILLHRRLSH